MTEPEPIKKKSKKDLNQRKVEFVKHQTARINEMKNITGPRLPKDGNYKISDFKGMSYNEIRPIFEKVWDFNQHIEPVDLEHGSEKMKSPEKIEEEDVDTQKEMKEVSKEYGAKRKKSLPRKSTRSTVKEKKMEGDAERKISKDVFRHSSKRRFFRGDGSSKNYKILSEMLEDFDRQDCYDLP
ncbi:hypothetical protein Tco_1050959 [Tanacetum coccineum]